MTTAKLPFTELVVVSDRPSLLSEIRQALGGMEGMGVVSLEGGPRPTSHAACLAALESRKGGILLIDAVPDPAAALMLVQEIFDHHPSARIFLAGSADDPGLILRAQRAGASEFLPLPLDRRVLTDSIQRLWRRVAPESSQPASRRGRIFPFLGAKGGCGTTTLASNLAVTLALQGRSTLLVDLDLTSGDASLVLNLSPSFTVADVIQNAHRLDRDLLSGMVARHVSGLEVLAASENPDRSRDLEPARIAQLLGFLREHYECVVVNTAGPWDPVAHSVVNHSDLIHLVSCLDLLSLRRAQWTLRRLTHLGLSPEMIRLVINRYERNPYISLEEAEKILDLKVAWSVPLDVRTAQDALNEGIPLVNRSRNGMLGSFQAYATGLAGGGNAAAEPASRKKFFGWIPARGGASDRSGDSPA